MQDAPVYRLDSLPLLFLISFLIFLLPSPLFFLEVWELTGCFRKQELKNPGYNFCIFAHTTREVINMASYVSPAIRDKFETLSVNLKNCILERNVHLETIHDLIRVLEEICAEAEQ